MMDNCDVVQDLLPLYIDDVCSGASAKLIRAHLDGCPKCREMLRQLGRETYTRPEEPSVEEVLKKTSYVLSKRAVYSALGVLTIIVYWVVYFWQEHWANMGDYRFFSWSFHETYTVGLLIVPPATLVWLVVLLVKSIRHKTWRKNLAMLLVLMVLVGGQAGIFIDLNNTWSSYSWTQIVDIPDNHHIVIERANGSRITLETSVQVTNLVEEMGPVYQIGYEWNERNPDEGVLNYIEVTNIPVEYAKP